MSSNNRGFYIDVPRRPLKRKLATKIIPPPSPSTMIEESGVEESPKKRMKYVLVPEPKFAPPKEKLLAAVDSPPPSVSSSDMAIEPLLAPSESASDSGSTTMLEHEDEAEDSTEAQFTFIYSVEEDDAIEETLVLDGETPAEDAEDVEDDDDDNDDIPVRLINDFTIYYLDTHEVVPLSKLMEVGQPSARKYGASGLVDVSVEDDDDDETDGGSSNGSRDLDSLKRATLTVILEFSTFSLGDRRLFNTKLYIKTEFAWYILASPSVQYRPFFAPYYCAHRLTAILLVTTKTSRRLTYNCFVHDIERLDDEVEALIATKRLIGRTLTRQDVESAQNRTFIANRLTELKQEGIISTLRVPAMQAFIAGSFGESDSSSSEDGSYEAEAVNEDEEDDTSETAASTTTSTPASSVRKKGNKALKIYGKTYLTPIVSRLSVDLFGGNIELSHLDDEEKVASSVQARERVCHATDPTKIVWGSQMMEDEEVYENVKVDGTKYRAGDIVMVEPSSWPEKNPHASQTVNKFGNQQWFCQIRYFFSDHKGDKMFHAQWFVHGCKTILQETSHTQALYLLKGSCSDSPISSIFRKCDLTLLDPGDEEPDDEKKTDSPDFHCALMYDEEKYSFEDIPDEALAIEKDCMYKSCYSCSLKAEEELTCYVRLPASEDEVIIFGITYHVYDCVYVHPEDNAGNLLRIGQIVEVVRDSGKKKDDVLVKVRFMGRYDEHVRAKREEEGLGRYDSSTELVCDDRRLFLTDEIEDVPADTIDGRCHVRHLSVTEEIEKWVRHDDHFYLNQEGTVEALEPIRKSAFDYCKECRDDDEAERDEKDKFLATNSKLVGLELFAGAGGLGIGMDLSGFVETKYAVEFNVSAAKTYTRNHPDTAVYCQDSNKLLKHAVESMGDNPPPPLVSMDGKTFCPAMPKKSDGIDFIFGGPPCQSFSRANMHKDPDDVRTTMSANMLSYVEFYEPNYFLLENVDGFLTHKLGMIRPSDDPASKPSKVQVEWVMVKFVARSLMALGYQVRWQLLQASCYGVPQSRRRTIIWGSKRGLPLPDFPLPMYAYTGRICKVYPPSGPVGKHLDPVTRSRDPEAWHSYAPLKGINIQDAIGDLPPFDWKNPHLLHAATVKDLKESRERRRAGIPEFDAADDLDGDGTAVKDLFALLPGFPLGEKYALRPQNRFQMWLRRGMAKDDEVTAHHTYRVKAKIVEATCNIKLEAGANHKSLPRDLYDKYPKNPTAQSLKQIYYGRLGGTANFKCVTTSISPISKDQWPLHPWLHRVYTVREVARAQGFPDDYIFESEMSKGQAIVKDQFKQIGNAVAVPFALALGKELGRALVVAWKQREREGSPVV